MSTEKNTAPAHHQPETHAGPSRRVMRPRVQLCMMGPMGEQREAVALAEGILRESAVKHAFFLPSDAIIRLKYDINGERLICDASIIPEPCFLLPSGWSNMVFFVEWRGSHRPTTSSARQQSRPKAPYPKLPMPPAPMAKSVEKWMFYLYDAEHGGKSGVVCVHSRFCVTFRHGSHHQINVGDALTIYEANKEVNEQDGIKVRAITINEELDFILLKSESGKVIDSGPPLADAKKSEPFILLGFRDEEQTLSCLPGTVNSVLGFYTSFVGDSKLLGPFILGTGQSADGDSGGGCWSASGLIGMNLSVRMMSSTFHETAVAEAATDSPKNVISPAQAFKTAYIAELYREKLEKEAASEKKHCDEFNMQLIEPLE